MDNISDYFQANPGLFGYVIILLGILLIIGGIRSWNWLFEMGDSKMFSLYWYESRFGRKTARVVCGITGVVLIGIGIAWIFIYAALANME